MYYDIAWKVVVVNGERKVLKVRIGKKSVCVCRLLSYHPLLHVSDDVTSKHSVTVEF